MQILRKCLPQFSESLKRTNSIFMEQKHYKWMVRVSCMTFNHAPYITDALNGFTMQETTFPFVCTIIDDASTDGEPEVIRKYLQENFDLGDKSVVRNEESDDYVLCFAQHKTNKNCYFAVLWLKYNHYSIKKTKKPYIAEWHENAKYIAICEGDDYWIDSRKLQMQVDYLENNKDCILVHTNYAVSDIKKGEFQHHGSSNFTISEGSGVAETFFDQCWVRTLTVCYRNIPHVFDVNLPPNAFNGDIFIYFILAQKGKFHFIDKETGVYRRLPESASHTSSEVKRWAFKTKLKNLDYFMADYMNVNDNIRNKLDAKWFVIEFTHALRASDYTFYENIYFPMSKYVPWKMKFFFYICKIKIFFILISFALNFKIKI